MGWFYGEGTWSEEGRREEGGDWQAKCCAGRKGEGCRFEGKRFLKMWNRMYIYIRPSQDKSLQETSLLPSRTRQKMKEEEKKQQKEQKKEEEKEKKQQKEQKKEEPQKKAQRKEEYNHKK